MAKILKSQVEMANTLDFQALLRPTDFFKESLVNSNIQTFLLDLWP
jgi:hypothetical protein